MSAVVGVDTVPVAAVRDRSTGRGRTWRRFARQPLAMAGLVIIVVLVVAAIFAPLIATHDPDAQNLPDRLQGFSGDHLMGTDSVGRDQFSRLVYGSRVSVQAALQVVVIGAGLGVPLGLLAGLRRGLLDAVLGRIVDALMSVPALIFALTFVAVLGPGLTNAMTAIGIIVIPRFYRVSRAVTIDICGETFIEVAAALGSSQLRTAVRHVLPNALPPLVVQVAVSLGSAVTAEASLSYLGLGVRPPTASWGSMLTTAAANFRDAPHLVWPPGIAVAVVVLAFTAVGDGLREALGTQRGRDGT